MVFSSFSFISFFLPAILIAYYIFPSRDWRNIVLLSVSLLFYAWGEPIYVLLMIVSIFINWWIATRLRSGTSQNPRLLALGIILNLTGIGIFKYAGFFATNINDLAGTSLPVPDISLPIGISFYTFQAISYLVDVYHGRVSAQRNPLYFGTYLSMFPQLIAGPIVRYQTIEHEISFRKENISDFSNGLRRFVIGFSKKVLIANSMGSVADSILALDPTSVGSIIAWYAFIAYAFQIYFDFSGYSDMAIGLGLMFGFHFNENFNYPYIARSITEFWRRWHISLSSFFKDYVYIPLGGNRVSKSRFVVNLLVVWALTGLWHGASWNFVLWGAFYGVLLLGEKMVWGNLLKMLPRFIQHFYTIFLFLIAWVIFRIEDFNQIFLWFGALFGQNGTGHISTLSALNLLQYYPWMILAIIGSTPLCRNLLQNFQKMTPTGMCADSYLVAIFCWSVLELGMGGFNPFIYFRF